MTWVSACHQAPVSGNRFDATCPACGGKSIAIEDSPISYEQYRTICDLFTSIGEINRTRRLRWLSGALGRPVRDYGDLTAADATTATTKLEERVHGVR